MLIALVKLPSDACGAEMPGPASGLNAAVISQTSGSRNAIPMAAMMMLMSQRRPAFCFMLSRP